MSNNAGNVACSAESVAMQLQSEAVGIIEGMLAGHSDRELHARPNPGKWSVTEIIAHLADDELVTAWRYRQMIERSGCDLAAFDQDLWAKLGAYVTSRADEALVLFRLIREANLRMLSRLAPVQWDGWGVHAERGRITVRDLAHHMAGHDRNHINQIRKILAKA